jgi:hypothetical protein
MSTTVFEKIACQSIDVSGGVVRGNAVKVKNITASESLSVLDSGAVCHVNVASNAAADVTLPEITENNLGVCYEFVLGTANTGTLRIRTATDSDTTGDIFVGSLLNITNAVSGTTTNGIMAVVPGADDNAIYLDENLTNCAAQAGSYVKCTAFSYSADAHSTWMVNGYVINDAAASTGAAIFSDIDA